LRIRKIEHQCRQIKQLACGKILLADLNPLHPRPKIARDVVEQIGLGRQSPAVSDIALHKSGEARSFQCTRRCAIKGTVLMEERAFFRESETTKPATLNCPFCRTADTYELRWMLRKKLDQVPRGADERDRARFAKFASYMVLLDDKAMCKNMRCRKRFDISGVKTMAFI
jgi:hypothetical protein